MFYFVLLSSSIFMSHPRFDFILYAHLRFVGGWEGQVYTGGALEASPKSADRQALRPLSHAGRGLNGPQERPLIAPHTFQRPIHHLSSLSLCCSSLDFNIPWLLSLPTASFSCEKSLTGLALGPNCNSLNPFLIGFTLGPRFQRHHAAI
jgi:hypothetical protein